MDKTSSIIAALDAGKLPSQLQLNAIIDWILHNIIPSDLPELDKLTQPGRAIARGLGDVLAAYRQLGTKKNCAYPVLVPPCPVDRPSQMIIWSKTPSGICPRVIFLRPTSKVSMSGRHLPI
jgi:hypothetical protein